MLGVSPLVSAWLRKRKPGATGKRRPGMEI
jgi:hypothetical protein